MDPKEPTRAAHEAYEDAEFDEIASVRRRHAGTADLAVQRVVELPEFDEVLDGALSRPPDIYQTAVVIIDVEDQTYDTAAAILQVPIGTVRSRLFRGRRLLQERLTAYAEGCRTLNARPQGRAICLITIHEPFGGVTA